MAARSGFQGAYGAEAGSADDIAEDYPSSAVRETLDAQDKQGAHARRFVGSTTYPVGPSRWQASGQGATSPQATHQAEEVQDVIFSLLDSDQNGVITREELTQAFRSGFLQEGKVMESLLASGAKAQAPPPIMVNGTSQLLTAAESGVGSPAWDASHMAPQLSRSQPLLGGTSPVLPSYVIHPPVVSSIGSETMKTVIPPISPPLSTMHLLAQDRTPTRMRPGAAMREASPPRLFAQAGFK